MSRLFAGMERPALSEIQAEIRAGLITGLVGPDESGKTTFAVWLFKHRME